MRQSFTKVPLSKYPRVACLKQRDLMSPKRKTCLCLRMDLPQKHNYEKGNSFKTCLLSTSSFRGRYSVYPTASLYGMFANTSVLFTFIHLRVVHSPASYKGVTTMIPQIYLSFISCLLNALLRDKQVVNETLYNSNPIRCQLYPKGSVFSEKKTCQTSPILRIGLG